MLGSRLPLFRHGGQSRWRKQRGKRATGHVEGTAATSLGTECAVHQRSQQKHHVAQRTCTETSTLRLEPSRAASQPSRFATRLRRCDGHIKHNPLQLVHNSLYSSFSTFPSHFSHHSPSHSLFTSIPSLSHTFLPSSALLSFSTRNPSLTPRLRIKAPMLACCRN